MTAYLIAIVSVTLVYVLLGLGLNFEWAHAGLLNFGHVAFFAIGAYTYSLMALKGIPIPIDVLGSIVTASIAGGIVAWLTVRLKQDYLAIVTLALAEVVQLILNNSAWSGGAAGLVAVPSFSSTNQTYFLIACLLVVGAVALLSRLSRSKYGLSLQAIRDDNIAAGSLGKGVLQYKWRAFAIGSGLAGLAGALYSSYVTFISPDQFDAAVTFYVVVGIILGGSSHLGALVGTFIFVGLQESTQFASDFGITLSDATMADLRLFVIGLVLVLLLEFRPQGIFPYRRKLSRETIARAQTAIDAVDAPPGGPREPNDEENTSVRDTARESM